MKTTHTIRSFALAVSDLAKAIADLMRTIAEFLLELFGDMPSASARS